MVTVLPRGLSARRQYAATAIGLTLYLVGVLGQSLRQARERVSPYALAFHAGGWATVRRWVRAVEQGQLFAPIRASPPSHQRSRSATGGRPVTTKTKETDGCSVKYASN